jgi:hypothetical protein
MSLLNLPGYTLPVYTLSVHNCLRKISGSARGFSGFGPEREPFFGNLPVSSVIFPENRALMLLKTTASYCTEVFIMDKKLPVQKFRAGTISASIWDNMSKDGSPFRSVSFEKGYKNSKGEWQTTNSLGVTDLPKAIVVLSKAYEALALKDEEALEEA